MSVEKYSDFTISDIRKNLMIRWKDEPEQFKQLRKECGSYVFDAVMAVLLGGTGRSKSEQAAYAQVLYAKGDFSFWTANAGLRSNDAGPKYPNYHQRGFFSFPEVTNDRISSEFLPDMKISDVCNMVKNYPDSYFRRNKQNSVSEPRENFIQTLYKIVEYSIGENIKTQSVCALKRERKNMEPTLKDVYAFLAENEHEIADSIGYASELLLSGIDKALQALKIHRLEAVDSDDDDRLKLMTSYRDIMKDYRSNIEGYLNCATEGLASKTEIAVSADDDECIESAKVDYSKYNVDENIPHHLTEDFTHKKICAFSFENIKYSVKSWKDALIILCNLFAKQYPDKFEAIAYDSNFTGRKNTYFVNRNIPGKTERIRNTNIYVWVNLNANAIAGLMIQLLQYFSKDVEQFYVYLRADYTALHQND